MSNAPASYATKRWNPITGCSPVSAGCANCWASRFAKRHAGRFGYPAAAPFTPTCHADRLDEPLRWRKPQVVAVCFMGDLFHDDIRDDFLALVFATMQALRSHLFLVLTKRPARVRSWFNDILAARSEDESVRAMIDTWPLPNLWLGVSVEDQASADDRIPILLDTPAAYRWVSIEPQVGPVDLSAFIGGPYVGLPGDKIEPHYNAGLDWVVTGCEAGPGRRPFDHAWARMTRDQCAAAGVCWYYKQAPDRVIPSVIVRHPTLDGLRHDALPWVTP